MRLLVFPGVIAAAAFALLVDEVGLATASGVTLLVAAMLLVLEELRDL